MIFTTTGKLHTSYPHPTLPIMFRRVRQSEKINVFGHPRLEERPRKRKEGRKEGARDEGREGGGKEGRRLPRRERGREGGKY